MRAVNGNPATPSRMCELKAKIIDGCSGKCQSHEVGDEQGWNIRLGKERVSACSGGWVSWENAASRRCQGRAGENQARSEGQSGCSP